MRIAFITGCNLWAEAEVECPAWAAVLAASIWKHCEFLPLSILLAELMCTSRMAQMKASGGGAGGMPKFDEDDADDELPSLDTTGSSKGKGKVGLNTHFRRCKD